MAILFAQEMHGKQMRNARHRIQLGKSIVYGQIQQCRVCDLTRKAQISLCQIMPSASSYGVHVRCKAPPRWAV